MSRKEDTLREFSDQELLRLAESVSETPLNSKIGRSELIEIIKESLSAQEIRERIVDLRRGSKTSAIDYYDLREGGIGQALLAVSSVLSSIAYFLVFYVYTGGTLNYIQYMAPWGLASSILILAFAILLRSSMSKISWKLKANRVGSASASVGLIAGLAGILYNTATILGLTLTSYGGFFTNLNFVGLIMLLAYDSFLGLTFVLLGVFFLTYHEYSTNSGLWMATGIVYIISGGSQFGVMTTMFPATGVLAGIMGAASFLSRKTM